MGRRCTPSLPATPPSAALPRPPKASPPSPRSAPPTGRAASAPPRVLLAARQHLDEPVEVFMALEERFHRHALVLAMGAEVVDVVGEARMAVGGNAGVAQIGAVRGACAHGRND